MFLQTLYWAWLPSVQRTMQRPFVPKQCAKKHKAALVSDKGRRAPKMEDLAAHKILKEMAAPNVHCGCWKRWIQKRSKTKVQWKLQTLATRFSCSSSFSCSVTCLFASLNALNSIVNDFVLNFYFLMGFFHVLFDTKQRNICIKGHCFKKRNMIGSALEEILTSVG